MDLISVAPKVYVIILNYRGWADTIECLESVYSCDYSNFEVVVVDNGSPDNSLEKIMAWIKGDFRPDTPHASPILATVKNQTAPISFTYITQQGELIAEGFENNAAPHLTFIKSEIDWGCFEGFNVGIRWCQTKSDYKYLWILNNDTAVKPDSLSHLVKTCEAQELGICAAKIMYYDEHESVQALAGRFLTYTGRNLEIKDESELHLMDYVVGTAMLVSKKCLERGLLPGEYFLYFEDVDFSYGAKAAGVKIGVAPLAVVYHKDGKGSTKMEKEYYIARNLLHFIWKYRPWMIGFSLWYVLVHRLSLRLFARKYQSVNELLAGARDFFRGRLGERV